MPGCCVPGCTNSNRKGFLMRNFPSNPDRQKQWLASIDRPNWTPTMHSRVHFTKDMWEKDRCDGKRKLRCNAVPVISPKRHNVSVSQDNSVSQKVSILSENSNKNNVVNMLVASMTNEGDVKINYQYQLHSDNIEQLNDKQPEDILNMFTMVEEEIDWQQRCEKLKELLAKSKSECDKLRDTMKKREELFNKIIRKSYTYKMNSEKRLKKLREENQSYNKLKIKLGEIFNEDQIKAFTNPKMSCREWSDETIKRAIQLRHACGSVGYQQILEQHIPFPCERTLQRRMHNVKLETNNEHIGKEEATDSLNEEL
ncbi:PREDICTED: uncharacterized protein LOC108782153 isoform X2 [Cyphomyrmex costatus]|uniref:uncharacterized protein LOC108782153 isoform X2 n=1 Tax=Cyphomyrmex costatus TaxID=456900 RepID=UPI000852437A|nr:PREDICTED: uncharacterized protein LOC108782153 isoform X2 [Cyphomyrmex costatus]